MPARPARRALAGDRALGEVRPGAAAPQGPARARLPVRPHARGSDHRHRAQGHPELPPAAGQLLPDPDQVPRRDPPALRRHARARVHHEGRVLVRRRRRRADASYRAMYDAYARIFTRLGLKFRAVEADTGAIGGSRRTSSRCSPIRARTRSPAAPASRIRGERRAGGSDRAGDAARRRRPKRCQKVPTPGMATCEDVARLLGLPLARTVKCLMVVRARQAVHMLLVRGDHMGNEVKIGKLPGLDGWRWATEAEIVARDRLRARLPGARRAPRRRCR